MYLSALSVEAYSILAILQFTWEEVVLLQYNGVYSLDLSGVISMIKNLYGNDLENVLKAQFGGLDMQNDIQLILEGRWVLFE